MKYVFKNDFIFNFIKYLPKIGFRFLNLLFSRKRLICSYFRTDSSYCIEGTLNQLLWSVDNSLFVTLSNSSQIFFDSGQFLFHVKKTESQFQLTAYGIGNKKKVHTQINIVSLEKHDFKKIATNTRSIGIDYQKTVKSSKISLKHFDNHSISFQNALMPNTYRKVQLEFNQLDFLINYSSQLFNSNSIEEVNSLRETVKNNID